MEPYLFGMTMTTGTDGNVDVDDAIVTLDKAWGPLNNSFINCAEKDDPFDNSSTECNDLKDDIANYLKKYHQYNSKLEGSNELSNQYKELNDKALMRPINISFGIMILLVLISDLTVGFG